MRLFNFAIASIVDANTGYLAGKKPFVELEAAGRHGRLIRSKSVHGFFGALGTAIGGYAERLRKHTQDRRDLKQLLRMNDRMLQDIGLTRGDLIAVELGSVTLQQLYDERRSARQEYLVDLVPAQATAPVDVDGDAANQPDFDDKKIA